MRKFSIAFLLFFLYQLASACPVCDKKQPKLLRGIAHGAGPESQWDYLIVWGTVIITVISLAFAIKWLVRPGEHNENHIKRTFLTFE